jgi:hypothetical protein
MCKSCLGEESRLAQLNTPPYILYRYEYELSSCVEELECSTISYDSYCRAIMEEDAVEGLWSFYDRRVRNADHTVFEQDGIGRNGLDNYAVMFKVLDS